MINILYGHIHFGHFPLSAVIAQQKTNELAFRHDIVAWTLANLSNYYARNERKVKKIGIFLVFNTLNNM